MLLVDEVEILWIPDLGHLFFFFPSSVAGWWGIWARDLSSGLPWTQARCKPSQAEFTPIEYWHSKKEPEVPLWSYVLLQTRAIVWLENMSDRPHEDDVAANTVESALWIQQQPLDVHIR